MKKRMIMLVACVLVVATVLTVFTACKTNYVKVSALTITDNAEVSAESTAKKLEVGADYSYEWSTGRLVAFSKQNYSSALGTFETTYTVVNAETGANILSGYDIPYSVRTTDYSLVMEGLFYVKDADTGLISFYSPNGIIVGGKDASDLIDPDRNLVYASCYFDGNLDLGDGQVISESEDGHYTLQNKSVSISGPVDEREMADTANYRLYAYSSYEFAVYEKETMTKVRDFTIADIIGEEHSNLRNYIAVLLPDDNLLVQTRITLPFNTTKDYDYYASSSYYQVRTFIYDIEKGKAIEKKDFEYVFSSGVYYEEAGVTICSVQKIGDDKLLNSAIIQGFDGKLNIALDVQKILPLANGCSVRGDYVVFKSDSKTVYYKGDEKLLEVETAKMNVTDKYLHDSDLFVSTDGNTLFNADGSYMTSLADLGASAFVKLDSAKKYVYYTKVEENEAGISETNLYYLDRSSGASVLIAKQGSYSLTQSNLGIYVAEDSSRHGYYNLFDFDTGKLLVSGTGSLNAQYVCATESGYVFRLTFLNEQTSQKETYYYLIG